MEPGVFKTELESVRDRFLNANLRILELTFFTGYAPIVFGTHEGRTEYLKGHSIEDIKERANAFPELRGYVDRYGPREGYWRWTRSLPRKTNRLIYQQSLVFLVTVFEAFISDALLLVFRKEPRRLSSGKIVSWAEVIELGDYDSVLNYFAAKRVDDIVSGDWYNIVKEFNELFNIDLSGEIGGKRIAEIFEIRHAIVHNVALADRRFMNKVGVSAWGLKYATNKEIILNQQVLDKMTDYVTKAVFLIYDNLLRKFGTS
jgi:hypothetical protein